MQAHVVDAGPLVRGLCDQFELVRIIDGLAKWDPHRSKLSPGERIQALILGPLAPMPVTASHGRGAR